MCKVSQVWLSNPKLVCASHCGVASDFMFVISPIRFCLLRKVMLGLVCVLSEMPVLPVGLS